MCMAGECARVRLLSHRQIPHALYDGYRLRFRRIGFVVKEIKLDEPN